MQIYVQENKHDNTFFILLNVIMTSHCLMHTYIYMYYFTLFKAHYKNLTLTVII